MKERPGNRVDCVLLKLLTTRSQRWPPAHSFFLLMHLFVLLHTQRNNGSLKGFVLLLKNHSFVWGTILDYLKKSFRKWLFKEPWFERFFVEPEMVPWRIIYEGSLEHLYRFFKELFKKWFFKDPRLKGSCGTRNGALKNHLWRFFGTPL